MSRQNIRQRIRDAISPKLYPAVQKRSRDINHFILALAAGTLIPLILSASIYAKTGNWQILALSVGLCMALFCIITAWHALQHENLEKTGNWLLASVIISFGSLHLLFYNITSETIFGAMLLILLIGSLIFPDKWLRWTLTLIFFILSIGLVDIISPKFRITGGATLIANFTLGISMLIGLGMLWQTIRMGEKIDLLEQALEEIQRTDGKLRRKLDELTVLHTVALAATEEDNEDALIERATHIIGESLFPDAFGVMLLNTSNNTLYAHRSYRRHRGPSPLGPIPAGQGITGFVATTGQPKCVVDVSQDPLYIQTTLSTQSELCVPLTVGGEIIGVINAESDQLGTFTEYDENLMATLAGQLATAIARLRGVDAAQQRAQQFAAIYKVGHKITTLLTLEELLPAISRLVVEVLHWSNCEIALIEDQKLVFYAGYGGYTDMGFLPGNQLDLGEGITGRVAESGQTILITDVFASPNYIAYPGLPHIRAELAVPLTYKDHLIGVIDVKSKRTNGLDHHDAAILEILASQVAAAIENTQLFQAERDRTHELEILRQAGIQLTTKLALKPALNAILESALKLTAADDVHIFLYDGEKLHFGAALWRDGSTEDAFTELRENGVTYTVARNKKRLVVDEIQGHPFFQNTAWSGAIAGLPLRIKEQVVGVLNVAYTDPHSFDEHELRILGFLGDQAAIVIHNVRLFEATERQLKELAILHAVATTAAQVTHEDALIECASDLIGQALYSDSFGVVLVENEQLRFHTSYRWYENHTKSTPLSLGQGIVGQVAHDGRPRNIGDVSKIDNYVAVSSNIRSELCVPLKAGGNIIGVINAENTHLNAFTIEDERLLMTFAHQLAAGIEKARLFTEIAEALTREQRLNAFTRTISHGLDINDILQKAARQAAELVGADASSLRLLAPEGNHLSLPYTHNLPPNIAQTLPTGQGISWQILEKRQAVLLSEYSQHPHAWAEMTAVGVHALIGVPITVNETIIGTLGLFSLNPEIHFTDRDLALTESIGRHLGIAIQNARLYTQVQERAVELAQALERLQGLDQLKNEFIQNVSHELRTPLAIIRGYAELLSAGQIGELAEAQQEPLAIITRRSKMMVTMVEDLTTILEVEAQQMTHEAIDIVGLARTVLADFKIRAQEADINITGDIQAQSAWLLGDSLKLRRVFDNLIGNALKFTPQQGTITLHLHATEQTLQLQVSDTGIGIPEEKLDRVFERFYQVDGSMKRRYGGTGLGLALVKEIIEAHNGEVAVTSVLGEGTRFIITLPKPTPEDLLAASMQVQTP